jgi:hypothetical protein
MDTRTILGIIGMGIPLLAILVTLIVRGKRVLE